ncbi:MAG TPA: C25 family cysteine peptidase [Blastocatellia bacterium]|nr:C25 family cysteine peptidase [Blastocatellia bacterium]
MMHAFYNRALSVAVATSFCFSLLTVLVASGRSVASSSGPNIASSSSAIEPALSTASLERTRDDMMRQMTALKQEIGRKGETPELGEKYDRLANQIHEVSRQIARTDTSLSAQPSAPTANVCISNSLSASDNTFQRPNPQGTPQPVCPTAFTPPACPGTTPNVRFDNFGFNLTSCTTFPTCVTISMCGAAPCAGDITQNIDTLIYVYRTGGATAGTGAVNPFVKATPCLNLLGGNDDGAGCGAGNDALRSSCTINLGPGHFVVVVCAFSDSLQNTGNYHLLVDAPGASCALTGEPTAVEMESFTATRYADETLLEWRTGMEVDNLGFNVYRDEGGKRIRLNSKTIAGSALLAGPGVKLGAGNSYAWSDNLPAGKNSQYWLEDLGLDGQSTWHGPFGADRSAPGGGVPSPGKGKISILSKLGSDAAQQSQSGPPARSAKPPEVNATSLSAQAGLASHPSLKMGVKQEGWYRVTQPELVAAGLDATIHPAMLQLFVDGKEQAFRVVGEEDGHFDASDAIEFYGLGSDSASTNARTYWLVAGSQPGLRISQAAGKGKREAPGSFPYTVERRDRTIYFSALRNGEKENFFGAVIGRDAADQSLDVVHLDRSSTADATVEVALQGVTLVSHRVRVDVNGKSAGELSFEAQTEGLATMKLSRGSLKEGQNTVTLTALGGESDISLADYVRITYPRTYTADGNALRFNAAAKQRVEIDGFTSAAIRVIDVTDPDQVSELSAKVRAKNGGYAVTVNTPKGGRTRLLWAFTEDRVSRPDSIAADRPSNLREPARGADLVIISHRDFIDGVQPLKALRESQGFSIAVVDVEDVYDEFNFGQKSPQAIKDFLAFARSSWETAPRFVLLVGDASLDPKGYLGNGDSDFVPTKLIDTALMETSSDDWLADFDGDGAADMAIGRLPVDSAEETASMIAKIVGYDRSEPSNHVLLVSDSNEDFDFESLSRELRNEVPPDVIVGEIDRGRMDPAMAQTELLANLYRGQKVVNYIGHGSVNQWRGNLLTSDDARVLENSAHLPLFVSMTCLNGYFQDAALESLAESLLKAERGGAIAVWASSGMTAPTGQSSLNQQVFRLILDGGSMTLGEATLKAKATVNDSDVRRTWILFGDPTTRLR